jgi:hypothetical protein
MSLLSAGLALTTVLLEGSLDGLWILVVGPAVLGIASLLGALALFAQASKAEGNARIGWYIFGGLLLTVALGIGACFGVVMLG